MTGLELEMQFRNISIRKIAKLINKSYYQTGQKIKYNKFSVDEAKTLIKYFNLEFKDLFYEK